MNEVRLIDANALKYKNLAEVNGILTYVLTAEEIDKAPTIETSKIEHKAYNEGFKEAIKYLIAPTATSTKPSAEYLKQKEAYDLAVKALVKADDRLFYCKGE